MERIRQVERSCLRLCLNYRRDPGSFMHCPISDLYQRACIERIDVHMVRTALRFFASTSDSQSDLIRSLVSAAPDPAFDATPKLKPPDHLVHLNNADNLFINDRMLHYHRRYHGPEDSLVYNTGQ